MTWTKAIERHYIEIFAVLLFFFKVSITFTLSSKPLGETFYNRQNRDKSNTCSTFAGKGIAGSLNACPGQRDEIISPILQPVIYLQRIYAAVARSERHGSCIIGHPKKTYNPLSPIVWCEV